MNRDINKGFVPILVLIALISAALLGGAVFIAVKKYESYQAQQSQKEQQQQAERAEEKRLAEESDLARLAMDLEREAQTNELIAAQQKLLEETKKELANLKADSQADLVAAKAEADKKISEIEQQLEAAKSSQIDVSAIIARWRSFVSSVRCDFHSSTGELYERRGGSGVIYKFSDGNISIITSKHIVESTRDDLPTSCEIILPDDANQFTIPGADVEVSPDYDFAYLRISAPSSYVLNLNSNLFTPCANKAAVGESLVIIGYPRIGSRGDITATEGIISGYDRDYYITSAKVESGNSGGAAISLKNNCYLGIPTFTRVGTAESLARILDRKVAIRLATD